MGEYLKRRAEIRSRKSRSPADCEGVDLARQESQAQMRELTLIIGPIGQGRRGECIPADPVETELSGPGGMEVRCCARKSRSEVAPRYIEAVSNRLLTSCWEG